MKTARCRSCGAPIIWAINNRTGRKAPIDAEPAADGPIYLTSDGDTGGDPAYAIVAVADRDLALHPGPFYTNHFMTCPNAAQHKKGSRR